VFGASEHRYRLAPPLSAAQVATWEHDHGVQLPPEYRTFITKLGNGGAGPFYGLFPLGLWDGAGGPLEPWDDAVGDLRAAFPHREEWNLPASRLEPPDSFEDDASETAWHDALDGGYCARSLLDGAFYLCHHGCALRTVLVVTGPERGTVWLDGRADESGILPHTDGNGRHLSFGEWYRGWLERSLRDVAPR
jgi:hypothetical protein